MDEMRKEIIAVVVIGTVLALFSIWHSTFYFLPWKPVSSVLVFLCIPLVVGMAYARRLRQSGREVNHPIVSFSAVYWFVAMILVACVSGVLQGLGYK